MYLRKASFKSRLTNESQVWKLTSRTKFDTFYKKCLKLIAFSSNLSSSSPLFKLFKSSIMCSYLAQCSVSALNFFFFFNFLYFSWKNTFWKSFLCFLKKAFLTSGNGTFFIFSPKCFSYFLGNIYSELAAYL